MATLLVLLLALPAVGLAVLYALPARQAARVGAAAGALVFLLSLAVLPLFDYGRAEQMQGRLDVPWVPAFDLRFHLGVDGISLPLLLLTTLLTALCLLYAVRTTAKDESGRTFTALILLLEIGMVGTFLAQDLLLFFVFFEIVLLPMYGLIHRWGSGEERRRAADKFILYTLLGSALMLLGFLLIHARTGTFDMVALAQRHGLGMTLGVQEAAFLLVGLGFAIKTPMWPLHTWLPDAHTCAPTVGSVLLAGVLLKMGTYGLIRIGAGMLPLGAHKFAFALGCFGTVGIVYGALACINQARRGGDLKRLIAYSSVGHMGFVLLGVATLTRVGLDGALFASVAHGLITGLLFFIAGGFKERLGTTDLYTLGRGLYERARRYGALIAFAAMASLGLPGLAGFWGELYTIIGAAKPAAGLTSPGFHVLMAVAGLGMILTATYLLLVVRRLCMGATVGPSGADRYEPLADLSNRELVSWTPLAGLTLIAGLWPALILALADPAVHRLLGGVRQP
ncbi:NADH-quinone oxidoreductase subunit M [Actinocrinis puniceicyclus]|uniref:NADH-quinone oxidoreductase subunit M n=1 Tax=Actinocrinis puniceicyclus TaxID=977794 RepID=A0A8J8BBM5_9ACTN|nr:NADH-quinone oxidoreductase subunit M [Actinocrinis puniceicyclus]MBS2962226.1 NADH-quinone oxidoreductase subunit M [Actinocrinis puniceicyclus]